MSQQIWFHGTSSANADSIQRDGFKPGSWFALHMQDALRFGGPTILFVRVEFPKKRPYRWQVCASNAIPATAIVRRVETLPAHVSDTIL